jgi:predicted nucleic acid-binding protein
LPKARPATARDAGAPARLLVDSGAWLALLSRRDQHHADAERLFRDAIAREVPLVTTNLVLAEVHRLVLFRVGTQPARLALERVEASARLRIHFASREDHSAAREWLAKLSPRPVTYTDAVSFAVMEAARCSHVLGFDQDFEAAGFTRWRLA